nr:small heat shock protein [Phoronis australis]
MSYLSVFDRHVPILRRHYGYFDHLPDVWREERRNWQMSNIDEEIRRIKSKMFMLDPLEGTSSKSLTLGNDRVVDRWGKDGKDLKIEFDVQKFAPDEIEISTKNNMMTVHGKHKEEKQEGNCYSSIYREFSKQFVLPAGTSAEEMQAELHKDGVLTVQAPVRIPVTHK